MYDNKPWYNPKRDGTLGDYLESHGGGSSAFPLFKDYAHFKMLWDSGYLEPDISFIRIMYNVGRFDEHYSVKGEFGLEGIPLEYHGGKPGIHDPRILLRNVPPWEAQHLNPEPKPRKTAR